MTNRMSMATSHKKHASRRPRGEEGAGGAAPQGERAVGCPLTTQPPAQNSSCTPIAGKEAILAHNKPNGNGDKTLGEHANQGAQRMHAGDYMPAFVDQLGPTGIKPKTPHPGVTARVNEALATEAQQDAFCKAVVDNEGVKPAARTLGLNESSIFYWGRKNPDFRDRLYAALEAIHEAQAFALNILCNDLLKMKPEEANLRANSYGRVFEYRMRILGKLRPDKYGDRPGTQVNVQNNVGVVCDEATRERLIALNQKALAQTVTKELTQ